VSRIVGGSGPVRNSAARTASWIAHYQSRNRRSQIIIPPAPQLKDIVHEVVAATKSEVLAQQLLEELRGLREDFAQERAEQALQQSPLSGVMRFAPTTKEEWYGFITLLVTVLAIVLGYFHQAELPPVDTHEQEIVEQLKQINEHLAEQEAKEDAKPPKEHC
jgi:hypothetical protein